jgi:hypothetical protein
VTSLSIDASTLGAGTSLNVVGTTGADSITGGGGADTLTGGAGVDCFVVSAITRTLSAADITNTATQFFNPDNQHIYEIRNSAVTWTEAKTLSAQSYLAGTTGYLVTITSNEENSFVSNIRASQITTGWDNNSIWLGASDAAQEGVWLWATGPEAGLQFWQGNKDGSQVNIRYNNWHLPYLQNENSAGGLSGQFNNLDGTGSDYAFMFNQGKWDDAPSSTTASSGPSSPISSDYGIRNAYIVEYSGPILSLCTATITDLGAGGADVVVLSVGATMNATLAADWSATGDSSNDGTANLTVNGYSVNLAAATGSAGWTMSNAGKTAAVSLTGSANADSLVGGSGADTLVGGGGNDSLTGGTGIDRFLIGSGTDSVTDLGSGGADVLVVSAGATVNAKVVAAWTASASSSNDGTANLTSNGHSVNLAATTGANGWSVSNAGGTCQRQ